MTVQTTYRTCPRSGLQFEKQAEALIKINAVTAVVALLVGGLLAIGVVLTRWPAVHWLAADTFYMVLTAHGLRALARKDKCKVLHCQSEKNRQKQAQALMHKAQAATFLVAQHPR